MSIAPPPAPDPWLAQRIGLEENYKETEADKVFQHRLRRFLDMGLNEFDSSVLALNTRLDTYEVERAIDNGCPFDLVKEIFS